MKRLSMIMMCLFAMMAASLNAMAQEVTINLWPGWNWISYPNAELMDVATAMGDFVPLQGDILQSQFSSSKYLNGHWRGGVTHFMPGWGYMYYSNRTEMVSFVFAETAPQLVVTTSEPTNITAVSAVVGGTVMLPEDSHVFLRGVCWGTEPNSDIDGNHTLDGTGSGSFSSTLVNLSPNTTYYVRAYVVSDSGLSYGDEVSFITLDNNSNDHEYVDLGLPSGLLWATCNVGANSPEEYGDYFAWGEIQPKDYYNWSTYQYCIGNDHSFTKYCSNSSYGYNGFTDNLTTLEPEDDAATANWGNSWRMPTQTEWNELLNNTTCIWTQQNGVYGRLFTASNGNYLFLPATGFYMGNDFHQGGTDGRFWSSSLNTNNPDNALMFYFFSDGYYMSGSVSRCYGQSVRPVRSAQTNPLYSINAVPNLTEGGSITGAGTYEENTICTLTALPNEGYTFTQWTENDEVVSNDAEYSFTVAGDRNLVANFISQSGAPTGAIDGLFTINADGAQVRFSQGNLQYQASTNTWRFAESQWDYVGADNRYISSEYDGWIDLFGWGTSGYHNIYDNFNVNYQPYSTSTSTVNTECNYYGYGPSTNMNDPNLTGLSAEYDWGVHNAFSNGGDQAGLWRTLSIAEWEFVFLTRSASTVGNTSNARFAKAKVNGISGVILFPDDFSVPNYLPTPLQINNQNASFNSNSYSIEGWAAMENLGCIFLPTTGYRTVYTNIYDYNVAGYYWSTSHCSSDGVYEVYFHNSGLYLNNSLSRCMGASVRLVRDAE